VVIELQTQITKLEVSCLPSNGSGGDGPPHFGGLGLTCMEDLASWNMERGLGHYFGLFHDANSLLTFKRSEYVDAHYHVVTLKRAHDVGLNLIQAKLLVSFQNQVPLFFGKGHPRKLPPLMCYPRQVTGRTKTAPAEQNTILIMLMNKYVYHKLQRSSIHCSGTSSLGHEERDGRQKEWCRLRHQVPIKLTY
jgi:hypothetical protein